MISCFTRVHVDDVGSAELKLVLRVWNEIAGGGSHVEFTDVEQQFWRNPVLLGPRSMVLMADETNPDDPRAWMLTRSGGSFPVAGGHLPIGCRLGDLPDAAYVAAASAALAEALAAGVATFHRYTGVVGGTRIQYERIALPMYHEGRPDALCTVAAGYRIEGVAAPILLRTEAR